MAENETTETTEETITVWVGMAGIRGCMPLFCEWYDSKESAEDSLFQVHELEDRGINHSRRLRRELRNTGYIDLEMGKHGNEYASVNQEEVSKQDYDDAQEWGW